MKKFIYIVIACIAGFTVELNAQDFHLSQYDAAALNTNPALTGMFEGKHRIHLHYRNQWSAVATRPFQTAVATYDTRLNKKWSFGIQMLNYNAGAGRYNAGQILPSLSYNLPLDKNKFHRLSFGVSAGVINKSFDFNALTWGSQYTPTASGGLFDQSLNSGETFPSASVTNLDMNAGILYFFGAPGSRINPFIGFSAFHLNRPNESFFGVGDSRLPMRYLGHVGARIGINEKLSILPKVFLMMQEQAFEATYSALVHYYLKGPDVFLIGGFTYRSNRDALIADVGIRYGQWQGRLSYDFNVSSLQVASNGRGATELSITYILFHKESNPIPTCPRL
jgi:type IX secretion system PorP/SprF family membrane protein